LYKLILILSSLFTSQAFAEKLSLEKLVRLAYDQNPTIKSYEHQILSLTESASARSSVQSPNIGVSEMQRGTTTRYWTVSQKIEFPTKYGLRADIQVAKRKAVEKNLSQTKLNIRSKIATLYYSLYAVKQITSLTKDDLQNVKEFSRIAETKYAAGKAPMHDSMKAHFLQTQIEADLISLRQEEEALQARLRNFLNQPPSFRLKAIPTNLETPILKISKDNFKPASFTVAQKQAEYEASKLQKQLTDWDYAPDFNLKYQDRLSGEPEESRSISLEMSVPIWFWGKTSAQREAAHRTYAKKFEVDSAIQESQTKAQELYSKVKSQKELLEIMNTGLVPQAQTSYSTSLDSYKANKSSFLDLLDAERSLLKVKIAYYRMVSLYVENLTALESALGRAVSDLAI